jgi:hypothetical protein
MVGVRVQVAALQKAVGLQHGGGGGGGGAASSTAAVAMDGADQVLRADLESAHLVIPLRRDPSSVSDPRPSPPATFMSIVQTEESYEYAVFVLSCATKVWSVVRNFAIKPGLEWQGEHN